MKKQALLLLLFCTLPAFAARAEDGDGEPPSAAELTPAARLRAALQRHAAGDSDQALAALAQLSAEAQALPEGLRAEVFFAQGVVVTEAVEGEARLAAAEDFLRARALAGPGELRHAATYDAGLVHLLEGERWRAQVPELGGQPNPLAPPAPGAPPAPVPAPGSQQSAMQSAGGEEPPDPLAEARAAYEEARAILVERLQSDWRDADTRANLELIQRRLAELDELERQREEQQQEQQDQQQGDESDEQGDDPQDSQESQDDSQGEEGDPKEQQEGQPEDQQQEGEEQPEPGEEEQQGEGEEQQPLETQQEEAQPQEAQAGQGEPSEQHLSREEVIQLLDKLAEIEAAAEARQAALRRASRQGVARDW